MEYTNLGELQIPKIVIGTWSWGEGAIGGRDVFGQTYNEDALREVFVSAVRNDFTMYDTAAIYAQGDSERIIGNLMKYYNGKVEIEEGSKKEIKISTKFIPRPFLKSDAMQKSLDSSLERLQRDNVEIFWIHLPYHYKKWLKEIIPVLKSNKVKYVGVSNYNLKQIKYAKKVLNEAGFELAGIQNHFSLIYQNCIKNGMLDWCLENNVKFFAYMVMEQGALSGKYNKDNLMPANSLRGRVYNKVLVKMEPLMDIIKEIATKYDVNPAQVPVAWAIHKGTVPIIGVTKQQHVYELGKAFDIKLTDEEVARLEEAGRCCGIDAKGSWEQKI